MPTPIAPDQSIRALLLGALLLLLFSLLPIRAALPEAFPFSIQGDRFLSNGVPVFLNIIGYQPLEPGQAIDAQMRESRIEDDLRRFQAFQGGSDPVALRVYAQPTSRFPQRMPKSFYDGVRQLGFWIIRDIFFADNFQAGDAIPRGKAAVDAVIREVESAGALDRIFAWEVGNEFRPLTPEANAALERFLCAMRDHLKERMAEPSRARFSHWFTWASWVQTDPLRSGGNRVVPGCLDFAAHNAYSYDPVTMRDHQAGPVTGTPYAGYLLALKQAYPNLPLVISETGLADNASPAPGEQLKLRAWAPAYRYGGLTSAQVSEGLADRFWDARLTGTVAGLGFFEWNDEWHKRGDPFHHADHPEEHFGLLAFTGPRLEARFKLQQEIVRSLITLKFSPDSPPLEVVPAQSSLTSTGSTTIRVTVPNDLQKPVRFRWEASRGHLVGEGEVVQFHAGGRAFGPALITALAIDARGAVRRGVTNLEIQRSGPPRLRILTLGAGPNAEARVSGLVDNVDLDRFKLALYLQTDQNYVQPYVDMKSVWIGPDGYWWSPVDNQFQGRIVAWMVPKFYSVPNTLPLNATPPEVGASASFSTINDRDHDLLPDAWEPSLEQDRYGDFDRDGASNLEEFLAGTDPKKPDNDIDHDALPDNWERLYFGTLQYQAADDPDGDGLSNRKELDLGLHPGRIAADRDQDGLPDLWEYRWFGNLDENGNEDFDGNGQNNRDAYELGRSPAEKPPALKIQQEGSQSISISWPNQASGFLLESSKEFGEPPVWGPIHQQPDLRGDFKVLTIRPSSGLEVFRLRRP